MITNHISKERLYEKLKRECGAFFMERLLDPDVIEIMLNPDGSLWIDCLSTGMMDTGEKMEVQLAENILATCATLLGTVITRESPILEGEFPLDGSRLEGLLPPVVTAPVFAIRKKSQRLFTLNDYLRHGIIRPFSKSYKAPKTKEEGAYIPDASPADYLKEAILSRKNIIVAGGTGSGKTTLSNAILHELSVLSPDDRIITIEDTRELQVDVKNQVSLRTSDHIGMQQLLRATMRLRPDRIVVGEVRGGEALSLLKAWNTGHPGGVATLHANSCMGALIRLEQLIEENAGIRAHPKMIAEAVNQVVFIEKISGKPGRLLSDMTHVRGYESGHYLMESLFHQAKRGEERCFH